MADRNVDRIKELELELGRWKKRVSGQQKELARLKEELKEFEAGRAQLCQAADGVLAETAKTFGERLKDGGWRMSIPAPSVARTARDYDVLAQREAGGYVVTVLPRKDQAR